MKSWSVSLCIVYISYVVYVFSLSAITTRITSNAPANNELFGKAISVSPDGVTAAIAGAGTAYIRPLVTAGPLQRLTASPASATFGTDVAINGDVALIGAPGSATALGAVYRYGKSGATFAAQGVIASPDGTQGFGTSVSIEPSAAAYSVVSSPVVTASITVVNPDMSTSNLAPGWTQWGPTTGTTGMSTRKGTNAECGLPSGNTCAQLVGGVGGSIGLYQTVSNLISGATYALSGNWKAAFVTPGNVACDGVSGNPTCWIELQLFDNTVSLVTPWADLGASFPTGRQVAKLVTGTVPWQSTTIGHSYGSVQQIGTAGAVISLKAGCNGCTSFVVSFDDIVLTPIYPRGIVYALAPVSFAVLGRMVPPDTTGTNFGKIVGCYGEYVAVASNFGIYMYQRSLGGANNFGYVTKLTANAENFGWSMDVGVGWLAVGGYVSDQGNYLAMPVKLWPLSSAGLAAAALEADPVPNNQIRGYGYSIALGYQAGQTFLYAAEVGDNMNYNGAFHSFALVPSGSWGYVTKLTGTASNDYYGTTIDVGGSRLLVALRNPATLRGAVDLWGPDLFVTGMATGYSTTWSATPAAGWTMGGYPITVVGYAIGSGSDVTQIKFGTATIAAGGVTSQSATHVQFSAPAGPVGAVAITITSTNLGALTVSNIFTYKVTGILSITPSSGPEIGGTSVTVLPPASNGAFGLTAADITAVKLGTQNLPTTSVTTTSIIGTTPAGTGAVTVTVCAASLASCVTNAGVTYTYIAQNVVSISPNFGPLTGGKAVTIFSSPPAQVGSGTDVTLGKINGLNCVVSSQTTTKVVCTTPAGSTANVAYPIGVVSTTFGSFTTSTNLYTYIPQSLGTIVPPTARNGGSGVITINAAANSVLGLGTGDFTMTLAGGGCAPTTATSTQIICTLAAGVTAGNGRTITIASAYYGAITSTAINIKAPATPTVVPATVPVAGGVLITLTTAAADTGMNSGLPTDVTVTVGSVPSTLACSINTGALTFSMIICTAPAQTAGSRTISVISGEFGTVSLTVAYATIGAGTPSPNNGPLFGGTVITISAAGTNAVLGAGTVADMTVSIGTSACTVGTATASQLTCTTTAAPSNTAGTYSITITSAVFGTTTVASSFAYIKTTITSVQPASGPLIGRNLITLSSSGTIGLTTAGDVAIFINAVSCAITGTQTTSQVICIAPRGAAAGSVTVSVTSAAFGSATSTYIYVAQHVAAVAPASGPQIGNNLVTVTSTLPGVLGSTAANDISVYLNGKACTVQATSVASSSVVCTAPSSVVTGLVAVNVSSLTYGWTQLTNAYTYVAQGVPAITPSSGPYNGNNAVTITVAAGTVLGAINNGVADFTVKLGSKACPIVGTPVLTSAVCTAPSGTGSPTSVTITISSTLYGTQFSATALYTYITQAVSTVVPNSGPQAGGNSITITAVSPAVLGAAGSDISAVLLGTVPCSITTQTALTVTCTAGGAIAAGAVQVKVQSAVYGQATFNSYTFLDASSYVVEPSSGPSRGLNTITVSGFLPPSLTAIGIAGVTQPFTQSPPTATVVTLVAPAHAAGSVDMTFSAGGTTTTMTGAYLFVDNGISGFSPDSGALIGGTTLTLTANESIVLGSADPNDMTVTVGGLPCDIHGTPSISVLICTTPAGASAGPVTVSLSSVDYGNVQAVSRFTYIAQGFNNVVPVAGPLIGGSVVTISSTTSAQLGSDADDNDDYIVYINGVVCPMTAVVPTTSRCVCTAPAGDTANVGYNVTVVSVTFGRFDLPSAFQYIAQSIAAVTPSVGPLLGGNYVTITATGPNQLSAGDVTGVTIGGVAVLNIGAQTTTSVVVQMPPNSASDTEDVIVLSTSFGSATAPNAYRYASSSDYTFTPASGPTLGQTTVTLVGPAMSIGTASDITSVTFGNVAATVVSQSSTIVTVTTPAFSTAGTVTVVVAANSGIVTTIAGRFSYVAAAINGMTPTQGAERGGTSVTITSAGANVLGSGSDINMVKFGTVAVAQIVSQTATRVIVVTAAAVGTDVAVSVTSLSFGESVLTDAYDFIHQSIGLIRPTSGPAIGGNSITIETSNPDVLGSGVTPNDMSITVNNVPCVVASPPTPTAYAIVCTVPNSNSVYGPVLVLLTSVEFGVVNTTYTYIQQHLATVVPGFGPRIGGAVVTITASLNAVLGTSSPIDYVVSFGANVCTKDDGTTPTATQFICVSPAGTADGTVVVQAVSASYGTTQLAAGYLYVSPTITTVTPVNGPVGGVNTVTITSSNILGGGSDIDAVKFGTATVTSFVSQTASKAILNAPAHAAGSVAVTVHSTSYGDAVMASAYTYASNSAYIVTPSTGPGIGGTTVTISGPTLSDQQDVGVVNIGGVAVRSIAAQTTTSITVVTNGGPGGSKDIVISSATGVLSTVVGGFAYVAQDVAAVVPTSGALQGGTNITISSSANNVLGDGTDIVSVTVGGLLAHIVTQSTSHVIVTTPAGVTPYVAVDIEVSSTLYGQDTLSAAYTYIAQAADHVSPTSGPALGGNTITIRADEPAQLSSGLAGDVTVTIGTLSCTNVVATNISVTCFVPQASAGLQAITIVSQAFGVISPSVQYLYIAMTIETIVPTVGPVGGLNLVTITAAANAALGSGSDITAVKFGSTNALALSGQTATRIVAQVPPGTGTVTVTVLSTSYGSATKASYMYAVNSDYTVTPASGPTIGGSVLTITGPTLSDGSATDITSVTIGGVEVTTIATQSTSAVTVTTAANTAGFKDIIIRTTSSISTTITGKYQYVAQAVSSIVPSSGPQRSIDITISATAPAVLGAGDVSVTFGGIAATVVSQTATQVVVRPADAASAGTVTVSVVSTVFGSTTTTYTFVAQTVGSISPAFGPKRGLNTLSITADTGAVLGTTSDVTVTIGGQSCVITGTPTATGVSCTLPAGALAQAYTVSVTSTLYGTVTAPQQYTYIDQIVNSVAPVSGPSIGGAKVTITSLAPAQIGAGDVTAIIIGSVPCDIETSPAQSTTQVVCTTRSSSVLNTALTVTTTSTTFGTAEKTLAYSYIPMVFGAIQPASGPMTGGNLVTITAAANAAFGGDITQVKFGDVIVTALGSAIQTASSIVLEAPVSLTATAVTVSLSSPSYGSAESVTAVYTYVSASSYVVTPNFGPTLGGTTVTISGAGGLGSVSAVTLGGVAVTGITQASTTSVTMVSAAGAAGLGNVQITGTVSFSIPNAWSYYAIIVGTVVPAFGPLQGGNRITISAQAGARLGEGNGDVTVTLGSSPAIACDIVSATPTAIVCTTHSHTVPDVAVGVTVTSVKYGSNTLAASYTFIAQSISSVVPVQGPKRGLNLLTIAASGTAVLGEDSDVSVTVGGLACPKFGSASSKTEFVCTVPAGSAPLAGKAVVVSSTAYGTATASQQYTYIDQVIGSVSPSSGPLIGGTHVTIVSQASTQLGSGTDINSVTINAVNCPIQTSGGEVQTITSVVCVVPAGTAPGNVLYDVVVISASFGTATKTSAFKYVEMILAAVTPNSGPLSGLNTVTITAAANAALGSAIGDVTAVNFGSLAADMTGSVQTSSSVTVVVPAGASASVVAITVVSTSFGQATLATAYTYLDASSYFVAPNFGPAIGDTTVTITGQNLGTVTGVSLNGFAIKAGSLVQSTSTAITVVSAAGSAGTGAVVIAGDVALTIPSAWTYYAMQIDTVVPAFGPLKGGNTITINAASGARLGNGVLADISSVQINSIACIVQSVSAASVVCTPGQHTIPDTLFDVVVVSTTYGTATKSSGYKYIAQAITSVVPVQGPKRGLNLLTIAASATTVLGEDSDVSVTVGGLACPKFGSASSKTEFVCTVPAGSAPLAGKAVVVSSTAYGTATASQEYTYIDQVIGSVSPSNGPLIGGTHVTIVSQASTQLGSGTDINSVTINAVNCPIQSSGGEVQTITSVVCVAPAGAAGNTAYAVAVSSVSFGVVTASAAFTYIPQAIGGISPNIGPTSGLNTVTITAALNSALGAATGDISSVKFGTAVASLSGAVQTGTSLILSVPAIGSVGAVFITITSTTFGTTASSTALYTYVDSSAYSIVPNFGPVRGLSTITISGPNIGHVTAVSLNGVAVTNLVQAGGDTTTVSFKSAAGAAGTGNVVVTSDAPLTLSNGWTYVDQQIDGVVPSTGPLRGGNTITIQAVTGTQLGSGTQPDINSVLIDNIPCAVQSVSTTAIVCKPGAHTVSNVAFAVTVDSVTYGVVTRTALYTYVAQTIGTTSPATGPLIGGTRVTIAASGAGRLGDGTDIVSVTFGTLTASLSGAVQTMTSIALNAPAATAGGAVQLTVVSTAYGTVTGSSYTYLTASISGTTPTSGPLIGANTVTISGTNFDSISAVSVCGVSAAVTAQTATSVTVTAGSGIGHAGACTVSVTTASYGVATLNSGYTYNVAGAISTALPASIPLLGSVTVTVTGSNLGNGADITAVSLNGIAVTSIGLQTSTSVTVQAAAASSAGAGVVVVSSVSFGTATSGSIFTYIAGAISTVIPNNGPLVGGNSVTVVGTHLGSGSDIASVIIGGVATSITAQTSASVTVTTAIGTAGLGSVVVVSASYGTTTATNAYRYNVAGVVSGVSPSRGALGGGTIVTVSGTDLGSGSDITSVTLNGVAAQLGTQSSTAITVTVSAGTVTGLGNVVVTSTAFGVSTLLSAFSYETVDVATVTPAVGPGHGGNTVTISGSVLGTGSDITSVTFNGVAASILTQTTTTVTVVTGNAVTANSLGLGNVVVKSTHYLTGSLVNGYRYNNPLVINGLTPPAGPVGGNTIVTIAGSNMGTGADLTSVTVAGVAASILGQSSNTVTIQTANGLGHEGVGDVVMRSTTFGVGSLSNGFSYLVGTITSVTPAVGRLVGGNLVTIAGVRLGLGSDISLVTLCGLPADIVSQTVSSVTVVAAAGVAAGVGNVVVQSPSYLTLTATSSYAYNVAPVIASVTPAQIPLYGGVAVTIIGTLGDGTDITSLSLSGVPPTNILGQTASSITVTAGSGAAVAGLGSVFVDSVSFGNVTAGNAITYVAPVITAVSPNACSHFGCVVTITGAPLGDGSDVTRVTLLGVTAAILGQSQFSVTVRAGNGSGFIGLGDAVTYSSSYGPASSVNSFSYVCALGTYGSASTGKQCLPCPPGQFSGLAGSLSCLPCGPGSYNPNSQAFMCADCPQGFFCAGSGLRDAEACPPGTFSNASRAESNSTCLPCSAGAFSSAPASTVCSSCVAGSISAQGSGSCSNCSAGSTSNVDNTVCEDCSIGMFSPVNGSLCLSCPRGSFSNGTGQTECQMCDAGTWGPRGASNCTACLAGQWSSSGAAVCNNCTAGSYSSAAASTCNNCTAGTYSLQGWATCSNCSAGSYSGATAGRCLACPAGSYCATPATVIPSNCTANTSNAFTGSTSASACLPCSNGFTSYPGAASCTVPVQAGIQDPPSQVGNNQLLSPAVGAGVGAGAALVAAVLATVIYCALRGGFAACRRRGNTEPRPDEQRMFASPVPTAVASGAQTTPILNSPLSPSRVAWSEEELAHSQVNSPMDATAAPDTPRSDGDKWERRPDDDGIILPNSPGSGELFDPRLYEKIDFRPLLEDRRRSSVSPMQKQRVMSLMSKLPNSRRASRAIIPSLDLTGIANIPVIPPQVVQVAAARMDPVQIAAASAMSNMQPQLEDELMVPPLVRDSVSPLSPIGSPGSVSSAKSFDSERFARVMQRASGLLQKQQQLKPIQARRESTAQDLPITPTMPATDHHFMPVATALATAPAPAKQKSPRDEAVEAIEKLSSPREPAPLMSLTALRDRLHALKRLSSPPALESKERAQPLGDAPSFDEEIPELPKRSPRSPRELANIRQVQSRLRELSQRLPTSPSLMQSARDITNTSTAAPLRAPKELPPVHAPALRRGFSPIYGPAIHPLPLSPQLMALEADGGLSPMSLTASVTPTRPMPSVTERFETSTQSAFTAQSAQDGEDGPTLEPLHAMQAAVATSPPRGVVTRFAQLPPPPPPMPKLLSMQSLSSPRVPMPKLPSVTRRG